MYVIITSAMPLFYNLTRSSFSICHTERSRRRMVAFFKYTVKITAILIANRCNDVTDRKICLAHQSTDLFRRLR